MPLDSAALRNIEKLLNEECSLCAEYVQLLDREQEFVIRLQSEKVEQLSEKREIISDRLADIRERRDTLVRSINGNTAVTLTQIVTAQGNAADRKKFLPLIQKLKAQVRVLEKRSKEFNQIVNFSLGLVNGSMSILWSAKQAVTRCYTAFGSVNESFQPTHARDGSLLGKA